MMIAMEVIAFEPKPSRPAPRGTTGALGWLRAHLFYSWWSTVLTLAVGYLLVSLLATLYNWGIADAGLAGGLPAASAWIRVPTGPAGPVSAFGSTAFSTAAIRHRSAGGSNSHSPPWCCG